MTIPSRLVHLPIAFDDSETRAAVQRYINTIRGDAPNCEGGNNIDYIVRYNGLADREELYEALLATEQWAAFIGFFPGLPFMFPLDPRDSIFVPKYNPTRTWTAGGRSRCGRAVLGDLPRRVGRRLPARRSHDPDLRPPGPQRGVPRRTR